MLKVCNEMIGLILNNTQPLRKSTGNHYPRCDLLNVCVECDDEFEPYMIQTHRNLE